ncbi:MAG: TVP38/TMEM64 family protein [Robiginitomaculum sp.]|nr:TVP38/TMEM64 family protein [Robiginitomaculum sp.]
MKALRKFIKKRSVFFWIVMVQIFVFSIITLSVDFKPEAVAGWFGAFANSPFAVPAIIGIYTLAAFVNAPQWMLHGGVILTFGPFTGSVIAWVATMVSASFDFWLGRRLGAERIDKMSGGVLAKFMHLIKDNGFLASLIVRIVPTGPFVVVNLAAGVTRMKFSSFFLGTGVGIIPKIALVASVSEGVKGTVTGKGPLYIAVVVGIAVVWMGVIYIAGSRLKRKMDLDTENKTAIEDKTNN